MERSSSSADKLLFIVALSFFFCSLLYCCAASPTSHADLHTEMRGGGKKERKRLMSKNNMSDRGLRESVNRGTFEAEELKRENLRSENTKRDIRVMMERYTSNDEDRGG